MNWKAYFSLQQVKVQSSLAFRTSIQSLFRFKYRIFGVIWLYCWISLAPSLPMYSAVGFPQLIHQQSHFPCEKWEWERKVNSCINSNPLLGVWKGVVENPSFYSSLLFSLEYAMFCEICSAKRLQRGERKCIGRKERCKVKPEPDKKKKNCLNIGIWIILSEREKGN